DATAFERMGEQHLGIQAWELRVPLRQMPGCPIQQAANGPRRLGFGFERLDGSARFPCCPTAQPLFLVKLLECRNYLIQMAGDDRIELVERQADAMIRQPILRKVIRPDSLAAIA